MLYFDESGYTGSDLINPEQPYFTLASVRLTEDEIAVMKEDIGYMLNGERNSISKVCIQIIKVGRC